MEHVVFFPAPDGTPAFRRVASFEDAVRLVEHLRNVENVTGTSVHTLTEVPLAFKAWYRVELPSQGAPAAPVAGPGAGIAAPVAESATDGVGSTTGIMVPDQKLATSETFGVPVVPVADVAETELVEASNAEELAPQIEVVPALEQNAAGRRDRGLGFFAR